MLKRFLRSERGLRIAGALARTLIRLVQGTTRWERVLPPASDALLHGDAPLIGAFWHNRLMLISAAWPKSKPVGMVQSEHGDSRILGIALSDYITRPIWGSSRRNPTGALKGMMRALGDGISVAITPDGPRGPRMRCRMGLIQAARRTGAPIVPAAWSVSRRTVIRSWDRFILAWPFGHGVIVYGEPIRIPADAPDETMEVYRRTVEAAITAVTAEADSRMGHAPIEPVPEKGAGW